MAAEGEADTSRATVKTYMPAYQKDEWQTHAAELGMSQSEFVKTMVQAGRRGFLTTDPGSSDESQNEQDGEDPDDDLEERVTDVLEAEEHLAWDVLLEAVTDDIETRLEETLADLQDDNVVRYSGRHGGYTLVDQ